MTLPLCRAPARLAETLEIVASYLERKQVRTKMFLLLLEPRQADLPYCVLLESEARAKLYKLSHYYYWALHFFTEGKTKAMETRLN